MPRLRIDGDLTFRGITGGVAAGVAALAPFGAGNPRPVFAARGVEIIDGPRKLKERHLKMALKQEGRIFRADRLARRRAARLPDRAQGGARRRVLARTEPVQWRDLRRADARRFEVRRTPHPHILTSSHPHIFRLMTRWQRRARCSIAVFGVMFAVFVALSVQRAAPRGRRAEPARIDPGAVVETHRRQGSNGSRRSRQDVVRELREAAAVPGRHQQAGRRDHRHRRANGSRTFT